MLLFLIAAGLTLVFGVMDFINLAHGVQYMLGAYLARHVLRPDRQLLCSALAAGARRRRSPSGCCWSSLVFRHLYDRDHLDQVLATFGIILFLNQGVKCVWGAAPLQLPMPDVFSRLGRADAGPALSGLAPRDHRRRASPSPRCSIVLVDRTRVGMLVRAGATNAPMVSALGVNIRRLFMIVFGFGTMLAGFAGAMVAPILSVEPGMGDTILILAFVVIVIGGIGSIRGAFVAALLVGLVDTLGRSFCRRHAAPVHGALARAHGRAGARLDADLSADGARAVLPPAGLFPAQGPRMSDAALETATRAACSACEPAARLIISALLALVPVVARDAEPTCSTCSTRVMIFAIAALALDLLVGYGGLVSFGHAAFIGPRRLRGRHPGARTASATRCSSLPGAIALAALFACVTGASACARAASISS